VIITDVNLLKAIFLHSTFFKDIKKFFYVNTSIIMLVTMFSFSNTNIFLLLLLLECFRSLYLYKFVY